MDKKINHAQEVEVRGHLIDSMILGRILDTIMDLKGDFQVLEFQVGKKKGEESASRLLIVGKDQDHLDRLLESVYREGAQPLYVDEVALEPARKDMVLPNAFYSTTNNPTQIYFRSSWIKVKNMMMDKCITLDLKNKNAECKMIRDIRKGDMIVTGEHGIRIIPQERPREGVDIFQFMSSSSSSERPTQQIARNLSYSINSCCCRKIR